MFELFGIKKRPDITHAADLLSSFVENPGRRHWKAAKGCLRYLKGTKSEKIIFRKIKKLDLTGFSDSDWAGDLEIKTIEEVKKIDESRKDKAHCIKSSVRL